MDLRMLTLGNLKENFDGRLGVGIGGAIALLLSAVLPALAHHPTGGKTPTTIFDALMSGLAHPVIGIDHLAFVMASGLLGAAIGAGLTIPIAFVGASIAGAGLHLAGLELPAVEWLIAASVLAFGILLALRSPPDSPLMVAVAAIAGIFHGYAYGESILGAEMGPLLAYLLGFAVIQLAIATAAWGLGQAALDKLAEPSGLALQFAGFVVCGVGATLLSTLITDAIFPA